MSKELAEQLILLGEAIVVCTKAILQLDYDDEAILKTLLREKLKEAQEQVTTLIKELRH